MWYTFRMPRNTFFSLAFLGLAISVSAPSHAQTLAPNTADGLEQLGRLRADD